MDQLGPPPTAGAVLNKLKYDGTFDQFRKTCLSAIEAEPSFRSHGEHVEVLSRRYLQEYKCKSDPTKNELRVKLKDYAVSVIGNPELQIGMPLATLVEKALESKAKELLPRIMEAVDSLREVKPSADATTSTDSPASSAGGMATSEEQPAASSSQGTKTAGDFSSLPLPIDIPGLNVTATKREHPSAGGSGVGEGVKQTGSKAKAKASDGSKEGTKPAATKSKTSTNKPLKVKDRETVEDSSSTAKDKSRKAKTEESGKSKAVKPKDIDSATDEKDKVKSVKPRDGDCNDDKEKVKPSAKVRKLKEDRATVIKDDLEKDKPIKDCVKTTETTGDKDPEETRTEPPIEHSKQQTSGDVKLERDEPLQASVGARKRKNSAPMRRSARLASHTSETKESEQKMPSDNERSPSEEEKDTEPAPVTPPPPTSTAKREAKRSSNRKRARLMISSSSEASDHEEGTAGLNSSEDEATRRRRKGESRQRRPQKRGREPGEAPVDQTKTKKLKRGQKAKKGSSRKKRNVRATSPVLVTRYNRTVRPNPKYIPSEETQSSEESRPCSPVSDVDEPAASSPRNPHGETPRLTNRGRK